ncbi:MAG: hypothetical protein M1825_004414 [Sarcosagium campestre]|nr:MAG: hypothetical protein M1825_004414 [Sarcosagium campestre]
MPKAEVGSTKYLNNKLKSKGLQRLRWYCQVCERQMRDENGFKCHTQSESHVRQMLLVGEDPRKHIQDFSNQFQRDFLQLLRTAHGEKQVHINHFYQEYIANKEHVHMNATKWPSLTEFAKHVGREGLCRVDDNDKGLHIAWIDNSPEALRRQDAIRKKERQDKGDEEREQRLIREQVERARLDAQVKQHTEVDGDDAQILQRLDGEKIRLNFNSKRVESKPDKAQHTEIARTSPSDSPSDRQGNDSSPKELNVSETNPSQDTSTPTLEKVSLKMGVGKSKNVFAQASKKNALGVKRPTADKDQPKRPMSEAERIMRDEIERKQARGSGAFSSGFKRQRVV